jgi:DsbC/DsbD-like thiol-disulfide interchange protein
MSVRFHMLRAVFVAAVLAFSSCREAVRDGEETPVRVRLVAEETSVVPGGALHLGVVVDLAEGWHVYWRGRSDSGAPLEIRVDGPDGCEAGETLWPAPERLVSPGGILDHVYREDALVIVPFRVREDFSFGDLAEFRCTARWVACREACVAGTDTAALVLPVSRAGEQASLSSEAGLFRRTRPSIPVPLPDTLPGVRARWEDDRFVVRAGEDDRVVFFPAADCGELADPIADAVSDRGLLALRFRRTESGVGPASGVIEIRNNARGPAAFYEVNSALTEDWASD